MNQKLVGFSKAKLMRLIQRHGKRYEFERPDENTFGEPTGEIKRISIRGIYHGEGVYLPAIKDEAGTTHQKISTMIFCMWDDAKLLQADDIVFIDGTKCTVSAITNLTELNFAANITLEREQNGKRN